MLTFRTPEDPSDHQEISILINNNYRIMKYIHFIWMSIHHNIHTNTPTRSLARIYIYILAQWWLSGFNSLISAKIRFANYETGYEHGLVSMHVVALLLVFNSLLKKDGPVCALRFKCCIISYVKIFIFSKGKGQIQ